MTDPSLFSSATAEAVDAAARFGDSSAEDGAGSVLVAANLGVGTGVDRLKGAEGRRGGERNRKPRTGVSGATIGSAAKASGATTGSAVNGTAVVAGRSAGGADAIGRDGAGRDALARAAGHLDALVAALRSAGGELLEERLGLVGRCEARLAAVKSETVAELARLVGEAGAAEAVRDRTRNSRGAAKRDVKLAGQLADLPETAGALADGAITPQHAKMIADAADQAAVDEAELLDAAASEPTDIFGHTVRKHVNERTADEDLEERRRRQRARREVSITRQPDGMYKLFGLFDPVAGARVETALAAAARKLRRAEDPNNRATVPQRFADALEMLVTRSGKGAKQTTTLLVIANYDLVAGQLADAQLVDGTPLSADELLRLALDAKILPALFDTEGQPLWLGRECRDANEAQRIALAARDRGCVGCGAANSFCQPHHIWYWENGGPTDIDNLCLLCSHCHHTLVHGHGADVVRVPDGGLALRDPPRNPNKGHGRGRTCDSRGVGNTDADRAVSHPLRC